MPTRRIGDLPYNPWPIPAKERNCSSRDHNIPGMQVFLPGVYEHECPECHHKTTFVVPESPTLSSESAVIS